MKDYKNKCIDCKCRVDNRTKRCKKCYDKWRLETKEERNLKLKIYQKQWYQENKPRLLKEAVIRSKNLSFEKRKSYIIKSKYGINIEIFNKMLEKHNFKCKICGKEHSEEKPLHIDHCHKTKKIRGLLCNKCNTGLGFFQDNTNLMKKAIKYLKNEEI